MKRLIVSFDGTWNNPEQESNGSLSPTNVVKLHNALADRDDDDIRQVRYYHPGLGGEDLGVVSKALGGAFGAGIQRHLCSAYHWLGNNYAEGDEVYLFGFSRGAFTVRSLGGFLGKGLLDLGDVPSDDAWSRVERAFEDGYRANASPGSWAESGWSLFHDGQSLPIHFVGVWDTVGALGIPDDLEILNLFDDKDKWQFHNNELGAYVKHARHAMAIDEIRSSFTVTRWGNADAHADAKEVWFPGVHSDVGGGYGEADLSDIALLWMIEESRQQGLAFRDQAIQGIGGDPGGIIHDSYRGAFSKFRSRPRNVPALVADNAQRFHQSAFDRQRISPISYPPYQSTRVVGVNESVTVELFAKEHWGRTGVYLEDNSSWTFSSMGKWQDSKDACDWRGTDDDKLTAGDIVRGASTFLGGVERVFERFTKNRSTDFVGTKRVESMPWFTLVGAIANDNGAGGAVANDGSPIPHQYAELCRHQNASEALHIEKGGYLYCFPNDVWSLYGNNRGSVQLTINRVG